MTHHVLIFSDPLRPEPLEARYFRIDVVGFDI